MGGTWPTWRTWCLVGVLGATPRGTMGPAEHLLAPSGRWLLSRGPPWGAQQKPQGELENIKRHCVLHYFWLLGESCVVAWCLPLVVGPQATSGQDSAATLRATPPHVYGKCVVQLASSSGVARPSLRHLVHRGNHGPATVPCRPDWWPGAGVAQMLGLSPAVGRAA